MDNAKLHLWRNLRNEPKLTHTISGQSSRSLNPPVSVNLLPGEAALSSTLSRALLEHGNYVSLPSFSLPVQLMPLMLLMYLLKCLTSRIICPLPKVLNILIDSGNVLFCAKVVFQYGYTLFNLYQKCGWLSQLYKSIIKNYIFS